MSMEMMTMHTEKTTLIGTLATVMTSWKNPHTQWALRQMTQNFLNSSDASASQVYVSASRSFQEARVSRVKSARGYFLVVGIGALDGLDQPSSDRKLAMSRGKGNKSKRKGESSSHKGGKFPNLGQHLESCQIHRPHVPSLVHRCPRSVRTKLAQLVVDHTTLLDPRSSTSS